MDKRGGKLQKKKTKWIKEEKNTINKWIKR
jgi:hypothetical protein